MTGPAKTSAGRHEDVAPGRYVIIGDSPVACRTIANLVSRAETITHLTEPSDSDLGRELSNGVDGVAILMHNDVAALRYALATAHLDDSVPIIASIFDSTVGSELEKLISSVIVTSTAKVGSPLLVGPCVSPPAQAVHLVMNRWLAIDVGAGSEAVVR